MHPTHTYEVQTKDGTRLASADTFSAGKKLTDSLPGAFCLVRMSDGEVLAKHGTMTAEEHAYGKRRAPAITLPRTARGVRRGRR